MVQQTDQKENEDYFSLNRLTPKFLVNSKGDYRQFESEKICEILNRETGLDWNLSWEITLGTLRRIVSYNFETISTDMIRELLAVELTARNLIKERNIISKMINQKVIKFKLDESFVNQYADKQPDWGPLGYVTYKRTYARAVDDGKRTEEYYETVRRVVEGVYSIQKEHCVKLGLPWDDLAAQEPAQLMFKKMWDFKFIPPGRGLWMMGTEFIDKHGSMALNNCGFVSTEDIDIKGTKGFEWLMDALMLGVGIGFDTKGAGKMLIKKPDPESFVFEVPDSREGWVQARHLLEAYFFGEAMPIYDFSKVRPVERLFGGFGGVASGPGPLHEMLDSIDDLLKNRIGKTLSSVDIVDIMNLIGKCVVAGNVRRSAEIGLGDINDDAYINAKADQEALYHHRWASNNSVIGYEGMDYSKIIPGIVKNGEPGIIWMENAQKYSRMDGEPDWKDRKAKGVNPCGEQTLESFELCCLVETFPSRHETYEEFEETLRCAYLYAKSVTLVNTHWNETNAVMLKNRRIGTSQSGIIDAFAKFGRRKMLNWCKKGYDFLKKLDEELSEFFCIPKSIKITTVKPSGTVSLLPGVSPGIHYPHSEYYIRRIRIAENSTLIPILREAGYFIEKDVYSDSLVVEFPVREENFIRSKNHVTIWEQVANAIDYQKYWSDNQVSITVTFKPEEVDDIVHVLQFCEDKLKGISLLPMVDNVYQQMPYEEITKEKYEEMKAKIKPMNYKTTKDKAVGTKFCDGDSCTLV